MSFLTCIFLSLIPYYAASITFSFTNISVKDSHDLIFLGEATYSSNEGLQVTRKRKGDQYGSVWSAGRVTYVKPLHLWDGDSTDQASFSTSFTFVIDSYPNNFYADGLTFFLAHNNSVLNSGGILGLPFDSKIQNSRHRFVAVEFDTYGENDWDPRDPDTNIPIGDHVFACSGCHICARTDRRSRQSPSHRLDWAKAHRFEWCYKK
ncbi:putative legume lectin domain, concanavalin A-like lectin/glucanase domain superfamily [Helianthus debilis subsp. tardiflorus]